MGLVKCSFQREKASYAQMTLLMLKHSKLGKTIPESEELNYRVDELNKQH